MTVLRPMVTPRSCESRKRCASVPSRPRDGDPDRPDRLLGRPAAGPGDAARRHADVGAEARRTPSAIARTVASLTAPCSASVGLGHAEQVRLDAVVVRHDAADEGAARAGHGRQPGRDGAARAALGRRERQPAGDQAVQHDAFERVRPLAEDRLAQALAQALDRSVDALRAAGAVGSARRDAQADRPERGQVGDAERPRGRPRRARPTRSPWRAARSVSP